MLPYKLTFRSAAGLISEVDPKNHNNDLGLEHQEEPNTEMDDFAVEQRTVVVSVNSPFGTPEREWPQADILDMDFQAKTSDSMPNKVRRSNETDTNSDRDGTTTDGSIKVIKCLQDNEDSNGWSFDMEVKRSLTRHRVPSETESKIPSQFIQLGETPRAGELSIDNHNHSYIATILTATSPNKFYMTLLRWRSLKKKTEMVLDAFYKTLTKACHDFGTTNHEMLKPGLIVACHYEGLWLRAEILLAYPPVEENGSVKDFEYKVLFIDEGEEVQVTQSQIRYLTRNFLNHRRRVQKCSLFNPRGIWHPPAVARFNEIVVPDSHVTLKVQRKYERIWDVSIKMDFRVNSKFDRRNVDIGWELSTFQRRVRIAAMFKPAGNDADDENSDYAPKQVKKIWETTGLLRLNPHQQH